MTLHCSDCFAVFPSINEASVDMVLTDLPYGTTQNNWDCQFPLAALWDELLRVTKPTAALVFTAQTPFDKVLGCSKLSLLRYEWIWKKNVSTGFLNARKAPLKIHENILVFYRQPPVYSPQFTAGKPYAMKRGNPDDTGDNYGNVKIRTPTINAGRRYPHTVIDFDREVGLHPTQKPVALFEYLVRTYTRIGSVVLDPCMGSGTAGVACARSSREFIGIEKDDAYFRIAKERIGDTLAAMDKGVPHAIFS